MPTKRLLLSNDAQGIDEPIVWFKARLTGNITADLLNEHVFHAPADGVVAAFALGVRETGADGANPLFLEGDLKKNGTTLLTTKPRVDKTAADNASTHKTGTGLTQAVLKVDGSTGFVKGDVFVVDWDITRTTPATEMADANLMIGVKFYAA